MSTGTSTPSWYDLLDVEPSATTAEIRAAWKAAIADLDPTDRRFRTFSQAAEVLLDPDRRAAYDAVREAEATETGGTTVASGTAEPEPATPAVGTRAVPAWLLALVGVLAALALAAASWLWFLVPADSEVEDATRAARVAAETAVVPVLSYDAADLEASRAAATSYLTPGYRKEYEQFFEGVMAKNAPRTGTVVETSVLRSGIVRAGEDRVEVFVLLDQATTNARRKQPSTIKYWVTVTMERTDDQWLVAGLKTRA
ncbi:DnaJ domain-containing protein [Nocardioides sp. zg-DK7169]|uniref:J domain-containing protein n=1 Tax=Nocardioides sp. zg-DK7169 TaxID=2736600 RepID=UPI001557D06C|nr:DnaJ domain-containing protein [Nocardioides sp. zg-DK7169]NPC98483.1 DnaJ domain-containing protein [Nocardioides sp. zg-DK7169]